MIAPFCIKTLIKSKCFSVLPPWMEVDGGKGRELEAVSFASMEAVKMVAAPFKPSICVNA
jgi:hypothetical protein